MQHRHHPPPMGTRAASPVGRPAYVAPPFQAACAGRKTGATRRRAPDVAPPSQAASPGVAPPFQAAAPVGRPALHGPTTQNHAGRLLTALRLVLTSTAVRS